MRVLIAGCGYVGTALGLRLTAAGHEVFGLRRTPGGLPALIMPVAADLGDAAGLAARVPADLDAVVYAAAAGGFDPGRFRAAYVDGPRNLVAALTSRPAAPSRFVFVSSTGVYHQRDGSWVDEDTAAEPDEFSGQLLLEKTIRAGG